MHEADTINLPITGHPAPVRAKDGKSSYFRHRYSGGYAAGSRGERNGHPESCRTPAPSSVVIHRGSALTIVKSTRLPTLLASEPGNGNPHNSVLKGRNGVGRNRIRVGFPERVPAPSATGWVAALPEPAGSGFGKCSMAGHLLRTNERHVPGVSVFPVSSICTMSSMNGS